MNISKYPHGFTHGVAIRNIPITINPSGASAIYWVDSVHGKDGVGTTGSISKPYASIAYATAAIYNGTSTHGSNSDIIYVAAGHVETITAAGTLTLNVPGLTVVFMGEGSSKASINYTTIVSASVIVSAANVTMVGPRFTCNFDALTSPITVTGADFTLIDGEWYDAAAKAATNCIVSTNAAARLTIDGWKFYASTTGTQKATNIKFADNASPSLRNIDVAGDFSTAPINITAAATNLQINGLKLKNTNATPKPCIDLHVNTDGMAKDVDLRIASGTSFVSNVAKLNWDSNCLGYNGDGKGGNPIGTADNSGIEGQIITINNNLGDSSGDALTSVVAKLGDGATTVSADLATIKAVTNALPDSGALTTLQSSVADLNTAIGTNFWIKKTVVSSAITFAAPVDITGVSTIGELAIEQVIVKTDSTGLAGGTNFQVKSNNSKGSANIFAEAIANLGANKTIDSTSVSETILLGIKTVLETGKKLQVQNTVADGTGAGTVDVYVKFIRLTAGATVSAL